MKIIPRNDARLRQVSDTVYLNDADAHDELEFIVNECFNAHRLIPSNWLAIALPQVWINKRAFITKDFKVFINPTYEPFLNSDTFTSREWCLSSHDSEIHEVTRFAMIRASYYDKHWQLHNRCISWIDAIIFQHETDHLDWKLIFDN